MNIKNKTYCKLGISLLLIMLALFSILGIYLTLFSFTYEGNEFKQNFGPRRLGTPTPSPYRPTYCFGSKYYRKAMSPAYRIVQYWDKTAIYPKTEADLIDARMYFKDNADPPSPQLPKFR